MLICIFYYTAMFQLVKYQKIHEAYKFYYPWWKKFARKIRFCWWAILIISTAWRPNFQVEFCGWLAITIWPIWPSLFARLCLRFVLGVGGRAGRWANCLCYVLHNQHPVVVLHFHVFGIFSLAARQVSWIGYNSHRCFGYKPIRYYWWFVF